MVFFIYPNSGAGFACNMACPKVSKVSTDVTLLDTKKPTPQGRLLFLGGGG
jgi:hypothetical protein